MCHLQAMCVRYIRNMNLMFRLEFHSPNSFITYICKYLELFLLFFETGSYHVALASLELTIKTRLSLRLKVHLPLFLEC